MNLSRWFYSRVGGIPSISRYARFNTTTTNTSPLFFNHSPSLSTTFIQKRTLFIRTKSTPNPDSLMFMPGKVIYEDGFLDFPTRASAQKSPLASSLFMLEGVKSVFVGKDFISVNKDASVNWEVLKLEVFGSMMNFFNSGKKVLQEEAIHKDTEIKPEDSEVVQMIKEILETRVRPSVQEDGGDVLYRGFEDGVVLLKMQGSCSGCPSSSVTLKNGIERMLMHWIPEVVGVVAVDDDDLNKINLEAFKEVEKNEKDSGEENNEKDAEKL